jgi:release factor glutamine methyltransferase
MNSKQVYNSIYETVLTFEEPHEAEALSFWLMEAIYDVSRTDILVGKDFNPTTEKKIVLEKAIMRLKNHEPIQHIIGQVTFYNRQFLVNRNVLIPRQETEELVDLILKNHPNLKDKVVVDIGTGCGIIPITIAKERQEVQVYGIDISGAAIETAKRNATFNRAEVTFIKSNILQKIPLLPPADIWVSNPPYVLESEKPSMAKKVLEYDPSVALFVPDQHPLMFYERIAVLAKQNLNSMAYLYFEINEKFGQEVKYLVEQEGFLNVTIIKDMQGKDRFISAINP